MPGPVVRRRRLNRNGCNQARPRSAVLGPQAGGNLRIKAPEPLRIEVVVNVGELDGVRNRIRGRPGDEVDVELPGPLGECIQGFEHACRASGGDEIDRRQWGVLEEIVHDRRQLLLIGRHSVHDAQGMLDIRPACLVHLTFVESPSEGDRFVESHHRTQGRPQCWGRVPMEGVHDLLMSEGAGEAVGQEIHAEHRGDDRRTGEDPHPPRDLEIRLGVVDE